MRIVVAPDSFKGSLTAPAVAQALADGLRKVWQDADIELLPLSDGGEGWVESLVRAADGSFERARVIGPLGEPVDAVFGLIDTGAGLTGVIEMAAASGLSHVAPEERDPRPASTYGTGELMLHALGSGARRLVIGVGGSATNDGGAGMAAALGARLLDDDGKELEPGGAALAGLARIDLEGLDGRVREAEIVVGTDVDNPLTGADGASAVYGPQKGASAETVEELDSALTRLADVVETELGRSLRNVPGAGAAGGLGFGLMAFCDARLESGVDIALEAVGAEAVLDGATLIITAEGSLDAQTLSGKVPIGVARLAKSRGVSTVAVGGVVAPLEDETLQRFFEAGVAAVCSSVETAATIDELVDPGRTRARLARAGERIARLIEVGRRAEGR